MFSEKEVFKSLGFLQEDGKIDEVLRDKYLLTEEEQDRAIILFLEELSQKGKVPPAPRKGTSNALCGAAFVKAYNALFEKWCV